MRWLTTSWIGAMGLIVIGVGVREVVVNLDDHTQQRQVPKSVAAPTVSIAARGELKSDPRTIATHEPSAKVDQSSTVSSQPVEIRAHPPSESLSLNPDLADPAAVIGRPFPLSAVIEGDCKRRPDAICKDVNDKLAKLAQEPRDPAWAPKMEALIEQDVLSIDPGRFQIRNIECRTSLCAAEVESNPSADGKYGGYGGGIGRNPDPLDTYFHTNEVTSGIETTASGSRLSVSVVTFTRR